VEIGDHLSKIIKLKKKKIGRSEAVRRSKFGELV